MTQRPLPAITPETAHFWEGARAGELRLQKCAACSHVYLPPRPFCPQCAARDVQVFRASGRATLYSYVIHHRPAPGFTPPDSIAVVQLEEGPRMYSNIVGVDNDAVKVGDKVEAVFDAGAKSFSNEIQRKCWKTEITDSSDICSRIALTSEYKTCFSLFDFSGSNPLSGSRNNTCLF